MVRVLSCHHFRAQSIGKCDEGIIGLTLAQNVVIIATEQLISIFTCESSNCTEQKEDLARWFRTQRQYLEFSDGSEFGRPFGYSGTSGVGTGAGASESQLIEPTLSAAELTLSHSFAPVDLISSISYNTRGHYILCLEKREPSFSLSSSENDADSSHVRVRTYFQWDNNSSSVQGKPMKARIAGLVSPTTSPGELGDDEHEGLGSLIMVELPPPPQSLDSPIIATSSCSQTGNIATLSKESKVHIYGFKMKEGGIGRGRIQYADFDLICCVQAHGFCPEKLVLGHNILGLMNWEQTSIIRIRRIEEDSSEVRHQPIEPIQETKVVVQQEQDESTVRFSAKDESIKVYLKTITLGNRRRKQPNSFLLEEFQDEISTSKTSVDSKYSDNFEVDDLLRLSVIKKSKVGDGNNFQQILLHPIRIKNKSGGSSCFVATSKEALLYHVPDSYSQPGSPNLCRVAIYPFTAPLLQITFDSSFLHSFTETGLETYSSSGVLRYAQKDAKVEAEECLEDIPEDNPTLLGVRPWPSIELQHLDSNDGNLCIFASPVGDGEPSSSSEDKQWTIYFLTLPDTQSVYDDTMKIANLHKESNPEAYFSIIYEVYLFLRLDLYRKPALEITHMQKYYETCKQIGFECFRKSTSNALNDWIHKGISFLQSAKCDIQSLFANEGDLKDPALVPGIAAFIKTTLPKSLTEGPTLSVFSPSFTKTLIEFLHNNATQVLVEIVIEIPWVRECQGTRLLTILRILAVNSGYSWSETLALILTIVTVHGSDSDAIEEINAVLQKTKQMELESQIKFEWLLEESRKNSPNSLTISDLTICLAMSRSKVHINVISSALKTKKVCINDTVLAFLQGVNLNSDSEVKDALSRALCGILESYFVYKLINQESRETCDWNDDEIRGLNTLVQAYLVHITQDPTSIAYSHSSGASVAVGRKVSKTIHRTDSQSSGSSEEQKSWQLFGKIPSFINCIVEELGGGQTTDNSFQVVGSKENFVKLVSLLGSPLCNVDGIKSFVINFIRQKTQANPQICAALQLLCETPEVTIGILTEKYPTAVVLYGKEMFGKNTQLWRNLVVILKNIIHSQGEDTNTQNADIYSTIIESVYLHLANAFSPTELEEILDKEEENEKIYSACKRIELANTFTEKVVKMSKDYLNQV